jgi:hypothetical protein
MTQNVDVLPAVWCRCVPLRPTQPVTSRQATPCTRGLSLKIPNNSNKSFSHLLGRHRTLSSTFRTSLQRFFQFCKHSWNAYFGTLRSSVSAFPLISSTHFSRRHFSMDFSLVKRKKSAGARSASKEAGGRASSNVLLQNHESEGGKPAFSPSTNQASLSSLPLSHFLSLPEYIPCSPSGHMMNCPHIKTSLAHWTAIQCFLGSVTF